jgi:hypothetical protein
MAQINNAEAVNALWKHIAEETVSCLNSAADADWLSGKLTVVSAPDISSWTKKLRLDLLAKQGVSVSISERLSDAIGAMIESKHGYFEPVWYGFTMTISSDGSCAIDLNYNPDCEDDPSFYDY